ncbi:MAG: hypothetical protein AMXMBFR7_01540 [Planctomycetota bacterium]
MALERKPAEPNEDPGYPEAEEYASDRRAFLWMIGGATVAGLGVLALSQSRAQPITPSRGGVVPGSVTTTPVPTAQPQAMPLGEAPAQPMAQPQGDVAVAQPPAQPQAFTRGEAAVETLPPAQPQANFKGDGPVVQPQAAVPGEAPAAAPVIHSKGAPPATSTVEPRAAVPGGIRPAQPPAQPQAQFRGKVAAPQHEQPKPVKPPQPEGDF